MESHGARLFFGALSVGMMVLSRGAYFTDIWRGRTRPHAFSWLIWGAISSIGFAAQFAEGAGPGAWARGFGAATCFVLVAAGFLRGERNIKPLDWVTLAVALSAIPLWVATKTPFWSVIIVCFIDTIGYIPTVRKAWHKPMGEMMPSYFFSSAGALFSLLAIERYTPSTWLYPGVLVLTNGLMGTMLAFRRRRLYAAGYDLPGGI